MAGVRLKGFKDGRFEIEFFIFTYNTKTLATGFN